MVVTVCMPPLTFLFSSQLQSSSNSDPPFDQMLTKPPIDSADKAKDLPLDKAATSGREGTDDGVVVIAAGTPGGATAPPATTTATTNTSKPGSPAAPSLSPSATDQKRAAMDVTSQGVQTTSTFSGPMHEEKEEKKEAVQEWVEGETVKSEGLSIKLVHLGCSASGKTNPWILYYMYDFKNKKTHHGCHSPAIIPGCSVGWWGLLMLT